MKKQDSAETLPAEALIDRKIGELGDWRGDTLGRMRKLIHDALPDVVEEWKWGVPVWSHGGIVCTGETYKATVKLTLAVLIVPLAAFDVEATSVLRISSSVMPVEASLAGSTWMRIDGVVSPKIETWATPGTCEICWARNKSP